MKNTSYLLFLKHQPVLVIMGLCLALSLSSPSTANEFSNTLQKIGEDAKTAGKEVGKVSKEIGHEIAKGSKKIGQDAKKAGNETKSWWKSLWED